jgi:hypothetical protein
MLVLIIKKNKLLNQDVLKHIEACNFFFIFSRGEVRTLLHLIFSLTEQMCFCEKRTTPMFPHSVQGYLEGEDVLGALFSQWMTLGR